MFIWLRSKADMIGHSATELGAFLKEAAEAVADCHPMALLYVNY